MITRFHTRTEVILANDDSGLFKSTVGLWPFQVVESEILTASETFAQISYLSSLRPVIVTSDVSVDSWLEKPADRTPTCCSCQ